ncbi:hypothetical protein RchiOBHm_Chr4g0386461 [Rosa chinensis]|uniref:Uncharacterized protein n=1 Tax=Rosa chinensis TaxID=74649 RepID=A0A2P6QP76_ROSCH|nr:hypothetical protein RchiOBHm_Chr4g0386461 [Rosa chinensis]
MSDVQFNMWSCLVFLVCNVATSSINCTWVREHELSPILSAATILCCYLFTCADL